MSAPTISVRARLSAAINASLSAANRRIGQLTRPPRRTFLAERLEARILFGYYSADNVDEIPLPLAPTSGDVFSNPV